MLKQIIGKLASLSIIALMAYMVYFDDFTYINAVTIYYSLILLMYFFAITISAICLLSPVDSDAAKGVFDMFTIMSKIKSGARGVFNWISTVASTVLLIMCGYVFIVVAYIIATFIFLKVTDAGKGWVNKYNKKQVEAILAMVKMARDDKDNGRVMSSESFKEKIAKAKLKAALKK